MIRSPITRLALGIVGLIVSAAVLADMVFDLVPHEADASRRARSLFAEMATAQLTGKLAAGDMAQAQAALDGWRARASGLAAVALRKDGVLIASSGPYPAPGSPFDRGYEHVEVAIDSPQGRWGAADFVYPASQPRTLGELVLQRKLWISLGWVAAMVLAVTLYLRRGLSYLDPLSVVPERIRAAFDTLNEGVVLLDLSGRVVLANRVLQEMAGADAASLQGARLERAHAIELPGDDDPAPWHAAIKTGRAVPDTRVLVGPAGNRNRIASLACTPITDPDGRVRGCLVTLNDLTQIERSNEQLRNTLEEVKRSQATIEAQNKELVRLALHDGLTGLLNRRAFFEAAEGALARSHRNRTAVAVVMLDVDHFKSFNDRYGHATGDVVLQRVASCLQSSLRVSDLCGRYGGEEFCALLDAVSESEALELTERLRRNLQHMAGRGIREGGDLTVTASLGVCRSTSGPYDLAHMLKRADEALYAAKHGGRNRVEYATLPSALTDADAAATAVTSA